MSLAIAPQGIAPALFWLRRATQTFTPNVFTATMGTGGLALVLNQFPLLQGAALALWLGNASLFAGLAALYAAQWIWFRDDARRVLDHPAMSMFFGAIPMGFATIVNGLIAFGPNLIGPAAPGLAEGLWRLDAAASIACGLAVPYWMFTRQSHSLEKMTAIWLIPIVPAEVAAATAGLLAPSLPPGARFDVVVEGYLLWAFSAPLALSVLALLFLRLALHRLPDRAVGPSAWLALGPIGTGALGLVTLGQAAQPAFAGRGLEVAGDAACGLGLVGGLALWGYGLWWLGLAVLTSIRYLRAGLPFNLGWWAFTFPIVVYTLATFALARALGLAALDVFGDGLSFALVAIWSIVAARTIRAR